MLFRRSLQALTLASSSSLSGLRNLLAGQFVMVPVVG